MRSSDKVALSQMTRGQSTDVTLQIGDCRCQEGMAELRGRKGPENGFKKGIKGSEIRWARCPGKGTYNGKIDQNERMIESWIRRRMAGSYLGMVGIDGRNV